MKPLVSVVMPSYHCEKFIGEAIESVFGQSYKNWELVIVEDGSKDHSLEIIQAYEDERIKLFCNKENTGIAEATNRGFGRARESILRCWMQMTSQKKTD